VPSPPAYVHGTKCGTRAVTLLLPAKIKPNILPRTFHFFSSRGGEIKFLRWTPLGCAFRRRFRRFIAKCVCVCVCVCVCACVRVWSVGRVLSGGWIGLESRVLQVCMVGPYGDCCLGVGWGGVYRTLAEDVGECGAEGDIWAQQGTGEDYITRSFMGCTPHQILLGRSHR
jgi:hypothetical protein